MVLTVPYILVWYFHNKLIIFRINTVVGADLHIRPYCRNVWFTWADMQIRPYGNVGYFFIAKFWFSKLNKNNNGTVDCVDCTVFYCLRYFILRYCPETGRLLYLPLLRPTPADKPFLFRGECSVHCQAFYQATLCKSA